ncbi:MAG: hypothetical protein NXI18_05395 [Alphaproteobacteria bacterium]|nr:hypothetical protein [Alphaproteobacteria bacterium]
MIGLFIAERREFDVDCTIDVECSIEQFYANVEFDGDTDVQPGDQVLVHGAPITIPYGERRQFKRRATVTRANWLEQQWTRIAAHLELTELYDLSFTERRDL